MSKTSATEVSTKAMVFIVDDHPIVRQGLAELITRHKDLEVAGQAESASQAMKMITQIDPDIAIIDISLKDRNGLELIKDIKVHHPNLPILALSMHDESLYAERALRAGAKGYLMKEAATENVITAIRKVLNNQLYISDSMASRMVRKLVTGTTEIGTSPVDCLSDRELQVFILIGKGFGTRQISEQLHLSVKTIESYRAHLKEKLNIPSAPELLRYAIQWVNSQKIN